MRGSLRRMRIVLDLLGRMLRVECAWVSKSHDNCACFNESHDNCACFIRVVFVRAIFFHKR